MVACTDFMTDPLFDEMRRRLPQSCFDFGKGSLEQQCREGLRKFCCGDTALYAKMMSQLSRFISRNQGEDDFFVSIRTLQPYSIWGMASDSYPELAPALTRLHRGPAAATGGERNFKVLKSVKNSDRSRLGDAKTEQQTSIAFNGAQLDRAKGVINNGDNLRIVEGFLKELVEAGAPAMPRGSQPAQPLPFRRENNENIIQQLRDQQRLLCLDGDEGDISNGVEVIFSMATRPEDIRDEFLFELLVDDDED